MLGLEMRLQTVQERELYPHLGMLWGVHVNKVIPGGAAAKLGLQAGDIIYRLDNQDVNTQVELSRFIAAKSIGDQIHVLYYRPGQLLTGQATLTNWLENRNPGNADIFRELSDRIKREAELRQRLDAIRKATKPLDYVQLAAKATDKQINDLLWAMHEKQLYLPGWEPLLPILEARHSDDVNNLDTIAWVHLDLGHYDRARQVYEQEILPRLDKLPAGDANIAKFKQYYQQLLASIAKAQPPPTP